MTPRIRVHQHADGRVAVAVPWTKRHRWCVIDDRETRGMAWLDDDRVSGPGWSELLVAELPAPDGEVNAVGDDGEDVKTPLWRTSFGESVTAWIEGVETPVWELKEDLAAIRSDALKMLAAVTACEKYRAEREEKG